MTESNVDWGQEFADEFAKRRGDGLTQNEAHRAAAAEVDRRRHLVNWSIDYTKAGKEIEDVDGKMIGMEQNIRSHGDFDEAGRAIPFFVDPQENQ